jgi:hypothetical protein
MELTAHTTVKHFIEIPKRVLEVLEMVSDRVSASLFPLHFFVTCDLQRNLDIIIRLLLC